MEFKNSFKKIILLFCVTIFSVSTFGGNVKEKERINKLISERRVNVKFIYKVSVGGHVNKLWLKMVVPDDIKDRQKIHSIEYSIQPDSIYKMNDNKYVLFNFLNFDKSFKLTIKCKLTIYNTIKSKTDTNDLHLDKYLHPELFIESKSSKITAVADILKQKTDIETAMKTFEYVKNHIRYELKTAIGGEKVLETGVGKCMDFSDLFVALLRANGIPAKSVYGIDVDTYDSNPLHAWTEVYLKKQGWVRFDATTGHSSIEQVGNNYVMKIPNKYITLSEGRNEPQLHTYQYNYLFICRERGTKASLKLSFDIAALE